MKGNLATNLIKGNTLQLTKMEMAMYLKILATITYHALPSQKHM